MLDDNRFGFKVGDLDLIITVIQKYPEIEQTIIFGSRAKGNYKTGSDVDIALKGKIDWQIVSNLNNDLNEETTLPYMFDVLDYNSINNIALHKHIDRIGVVFYEREKALKQGWEIKKLGEVCNNRSSNIFKKKIESDDGIYPIYGAKGLIKNVSFYHRDKPYVGIIKDGAGVGRVMILDAFSSVIGTLQYLIPNDNIDIRYFYYFLLGIDFEKYINGSTIPHIYFKDYKEERFLLLPLAEQQKIVVILDKTFSAIDQAKQHAEQNLKNAKELFNSYLQSIFSNRGDDWEEKQLGEVCDIEYGTRVVRKRDGGSIYPVYGGGGATFFMDHFNREDSLVVARFAMSEKCTRFVNGKFFLNDSGLTVSPKNKNEILQKFLNLQLLFLNDIIYSLAKGTAQKNLDVPSFRNIEINYPKFLPEQERIVQKLDNLSAQTKQLEEIYQNKLTKLEELKKSILQKAFNSNLIL